MGRSISWLAMVAGLVWLATLTGCGSSSVGTTTFPVPADIVLSPSPQVSLDVGGVQGFTGTPRNPGGITLIEPIFFHSSNTAVVTVANNGLACAGSWDSLRNPIVCTPGPVGTAEITATAQGVSSPPTTVYVHQHIDSIVVSAVPTDPPNTNPCVSKDLTADYQANAFSRGVDITATVGKFTWSAVIPQVVSLDTSKPELGLNEVEAKALNPGLSQISASVSGTNSLPFEFIACPVQSISLVVTDTNSDSFTVTTGSSKSITPTVLDSLGTKITAVPLSYCSSQPAIAGVGSTNCATSTSTTVSVTTSQPGGATVIASCTPPSCNIGFSPPLPIYPSNVINALVTRTTTGTAPTGTLYVSSTGCRTIEGCISTVVPVAFPSNAVGFQIGLPATPNSLIFSPDGTKAYLGTDFGLQGTRGLMLLNISSVTTVSQFPAVTGKVLAVSPSGTRAVVSDVNLSPNEVFVFDSSNFSSVALQINGATAAAFSPDGLKAFIVAHDSVLLTNTLYIYSTVEPLQSVLLDAPVNDLNFLSEGAFAYLAGGSANSVTVRTTCTAELADTVSTAATPAFLQGLPNATQVLAVVPPNLDIINVTTAPVGCPPTVSDTVQSVNLGVGNFTPTQFIVSSDGTKAYVVADTLSSVLVYDVASQTTSGIQLAGNVTPVAASLTPEGTLLYVAASDNMLHVLDTVVHSDIQQVSFPTNPDNQQGAFCDAVSFQTVVTISAATQAGSDTTYTYTLNSGVDLEVGNSVTISGMTDPGNNGTFIVTAVGGGTFTVANPSGVTATAQAGQGTVDLICNANLLAVRP